MMKNNLATVTHLQKTDDDETLLQSDEDRLQLHHDIFGDDNTEVETTVKMEQKSGSYWRGVFG